MADEREVAASAAAVVGEVVAEHIASPEYSGTSPASSRSSVVFPAPFAPESRTISPGRRRGRHRRGPGSGRGGRRRSGDGRRQAHSPPGGRWHRVYGGRGRAVEPAVPEPASRALASAPMRRVLGAVGRVLVTSGSCSSSSSPTSSGAPASTRPGPRTTSSSSSTQPLERQTRGADHDLAHRPDDHRRPCPTATTTLAPLTVAPRGRRGRPDRDPEDRGRPVRGRRRRTSTTSARGPGTTRARSCPGHEGNSAIAGHRTTYGAPFGDLDQLDPGDEISRDDGAGHVHVQGRPSSGSSTRARSACSTRHPTRRAPATSWRRSRSRPATRSTPPSQRLIIRAQLELPAGRSCRSRRRRHAGGSKRPRRSAGCRANRRRGPPRSSGASSPRSIGLLWWLLFHRHPRWTTWFVGVGAVPRRAVRLLHVPRAAAAVELLSRAAQDSSISATTRARRDGVARLRRRARARHRGRR